jgi:hypothetical protein
MQRFLLVAGVLTYCLPGCGQPAASPLTHSTRLIEKADRQAVFDAAETALLEQGYRIDRRDPAAGLLQTLPLEGTPADPSLREGFGGSRSVTRRKAEVRIEVEPDGTRANCKVAVQRLSRPAHRFVGRDRYGMDTPDETPIDRDAATTEEQNTIWQTTHRDKAMERAILDAILELAAK